MMTFAALPPYKAVFQAAALEVVGKFLLDVLRQVLALCNCSLRCSTSYIHAVVCGHHIPERRVVPLDDVIEKRLLLSIAFIGWAVWRALRDRCLRHIVLHSMELPVFS
jgi:hypothetical protein